MELSTGRRGQTRTVRCSGRVKIFRAHLSRDGRFGRERVAELGRLLARFEEQPGPLLADPGLRAMAERIVHLKRALSREFGEVSACSGCASGCAAPSGFFEGGRCCGTRTLDVFTQPEVRAMKMAGVPAPSAPADDGDERAGCIFRGSRGCTVTTDQRPARCVAYVCHDLRIELEEDEARHERIQKLRRELVETFERFEQHTR